MYRGVEQLVARRAHNPEAGGSSPPPATQKEKRKCFSFFRIGDCPPTIFTFLLNPPLAKGDFLGGVSQPLHKKDNNCKIFRKRVRDFDCTAYSKRRCESISFFRVEGITHAPTLTGTPSNIEGEFTQAVKLQIAEGVLYQKKERVRSLLSEIISTTKKLIVRGDFKACEEGDSAAY